MVFKNLYEGKRVLVTGHTGFKGSWLCLWLKELGAKVYGIALEPRTKNDNFVVCGLADKISHHVCDIKDKQKLISLFQKIQPQIVFHLAAQAQVKNSFDDPVDTYVTNLLGTVHVLEALRQTPNVEAAIMITSDKCYKNLEREWGYKENDELGGIEPYGASKACAEIAIQSYRGSFLCHSKSPVLASTRAGNVIGGGDWSESRIVPDIIRALMAKKTVQLRNPKATRPWQFVLEPLSGYLWLGANLMLQKSDLASAWNFGPDGSVKITVETLAKQMIEYWGYGSLEIITKDAKFSEHTLLSLDISKAWQHLHWQPTLSFKETVQFVIDWYKWFFQKKPLPNFALEQIRDYVKKAKERGNEWARQ